MGGIGVFFEGRVVGLDDELVMECKKRKKYLKMIVKFLFWGNIRIKLLFIKMRRMGEGE